MRTDTRTDYVERVRGVLRHIQVHLDEPLDLDVLADVACFSRYHFHRIFTAIVGETVAAHVRRLRLERAAGALRRTRQSVIDVALDAGYTAHEPFTRAFRAHFGTPPSEFRKLDGPLVFPPALCAVHYGADDAANRFVPLREDNLMIDVKLIDMPARRLLAMPHQGDYHAIGEVFVKLERYAKSRGLLAPNPTWLGIYYNDPDATPVDQLRSHACVAIDGSDFTPAAGDGAEIIDHPASPCAVGVHRGPLERIADSYRWLFGQWLPASGHDPADRPPFEVYANDPATTPPDQVEIHICIPLRAAEPAAAR